MAVLRFALLRSGDDARERTTLRDHMSSEFVMFNCKFDMCMKPLQNLTRLFRNIGNNVW